MGFLNFLQKKDAGAKPHGDKLLKEVDVLVGKDFPSISQESSEEECLTGSSATYTQISDKESLDKTKGLFRDLIYDGISLTENENLNSTLIFGVAGSGKTNGRLEIYKDDAIFETDSLLDETKNELGS